MVPIEDGSVSRVCAPDELPEHITAALCSEEEEEGEEGGGGNMDGQESLGAERNEEEEEAEEEGGAMGAEPNDVHVHVAGKDTQAPVAASVSQVGKAEGGSRSRSRSLSRASEDGERGDKAAAARLKAAQSASEESKEDREEGAVKFSVYVSYFAAAGLFWTLFLFGAVSAEAVAKVGTDWWLSQWSDQVGGRTVGFYLSVYAAITFALLVTIALYSMGWVFASLRAATRLHNDMMHAVLRCPTSFFDTTPAGRIINRFRCAGWPASLAGEDTHTDSASPTPLPLAHSQQ